MTDSINIGEGVRDLLEVNEVHDRHPVSQTVAGRLVDRFGTADDVDEASRDELQSVKGVGPKTAHEINPPTSDYYDEKVREGGLIPQYIDREGVYRHVDEEDDHPPMHPDERRDYDPTEPRLCRLNDDLEPVDGYPERGGYGETYTPKDERS